MAPPAPERVVVRFGRLSTDSVPETPALRTWCAGRSLGVDAMKGRRLCATVRRFLEGSRHARPVSASARQGRISPVAGSTRCSRRSNDQNLWMVFGGVT